MRTVFDDLIDKFNNLDVSKAFEVAVDDDILKRAEQLNRMQLSKGEFSNGEHFDNYSQATKNRTDRMTPARGKIKLKDTGSFYKSIKATLNTKKEIYLDATDSKTSMLEEIYDSGDRTILGLSQDHIELLFKEKLTGKVGKAIRDIILK
jgi:hypothetical protein